MGVQAAFGSRLQEIQREGEKEMAAYHNIQSISWGIIRIVVVIHPLIVGAAALKAAFLTSKLHGESEGSLDDRDPVSCRH